MEVRRDGTHGTDSRGPGVTYRLNIDIGTIDIGTAFTSASFERAEEAGPLRLCARDTSIDLPSEQFLADGRVLRDAFAQTLRGIVATATEQLGEVPTSVRVTYPAGWPSSQLLLLWEALVLAGIPDAVTQPVAPPKPSSAEPQSQAESRQLPSEVPTQLVPASWPPIKAPRRNPGWLVGAAILTVIAGVTAGVIVTRVPEATRTSESADREPSNSSVASAPPAPGMSGRVAPVGAGVNLPASNPLAGQQFIVPRGMAADTELNLANVAGVVPPVRLSDHRGRNSWPLLSADRRTIIYINYAAGTLRTMAADGSGDRPLIRPRGRRCGAITRASWSPADQSIMVVQCRAEERPDRLLVIKLDGTVVRELKTGLPRIEDPMISPDGHTVAYWANATRGGPNGGSIYTLAIDGSSGPVRLTNRSAGSDADPTWSPDGSMIAFRRRVGSDNFDVYVMRSDGSGVRPVATGPAVEEKPTWSPDGSQLMIISNRTASGRPGKTYDLYVLDANGGEPHPLGLSANVVLTPVWSYR
jgi:hypothetical protein